MNTRKKTAYILGIILYVTGLVLGLFIAGSYFMADIEAAFYGFDELSNGRFSTLRCPAALNRDETGTVRMTLTNSLDRPINPVIRTDISTPILVESNRIQPSLEPGQSQVLEWQVDKDNIDLGNFIFVKIFIFPEYPLPLREATCGILVIDLPFLTGSQWINLGMVFSIACLGIGLLLIQRNNNLPENRSRERIYALLALAVMLAFSMLLGLTGWWVLGGMFLVVCILIMIALLIILF